MEGLVVKTTGSNVRVRTGNGDFYDCRIRGKLRMKGIRSTNPVAVGDRVLFDLEPGTERGVIHEIAERKNYIVRRSVNLSKETHILAANLDQALLVVTLAFPKTLLGFIDRFLVTAEAYDIPAILIFNKVDLYGEEEKEELEYLELVYRNAGYQTLRTSATQGDGLEALKDLLKDRTSLISGHSGVGKSTLINQIAPGLDLKTAEISETHQQGQHTTTFAEMFFLPFGGQIIDTPGIRGFGLVRMEKEEIGHYFPEIFSLSKQCRFHNCLHLQEPGCAVIEAVENHRLAPTRYQSYFNMINGLDDENPYRQDIYAN
ncbi:MAG: ribosome small subunit-dependent GTPase A [Bacteroidota bacterium]|mgnify:CR=1 FL=1|nr:ribosome small subunit-dependent GTPase A [Bacteroidota bacterium]